MTLYEQTAEYPKSNDLTTRWCSLPLRCKCTELVVLKDFHNNRLVEIVQLDSRLDHQTSLY